MNTLAPAWDLGQGERPPLPSWEPPNPSLAHPRQLLKRVDHTHDTLFTLKGPFTGSVTLNWRIRDDRFASRCSYRTLCSGTSVSSIIRARRTGRDRTRTRRRNRNSKERSNKSRTARRTLILTSRRRRRNRRKGREWKERRSNLRRSERENERERKNS